MGTTEDCKAHSRCSIGSPRVHFDVQLPPCGPRRSGRAGGATSCNSPSRCLTTAHSTPHSPTAQEALCNAMSGQPKSDKRLYVGNLAASVDECVPFPSPCYR